MFTIPGLLAQAFKFVDDGLRAHKLHNQITKPNISGFNGTHLNFWQLDPATAGPANRNEDDRGLVCLMKPSVFLRLGSREDVSDSDPDRIARYRERIALGLPMASPSMVLGCDPHNYVPVLAADGRQRMQAILASIGDTPVPVILRASKREYFDSPQELLALLRVEEKGMQLIGRAVVSMSGIIECKPDLPFIAASLRRLHYCGDEPSFREHDDFKRHLTGPFGPMA